MPHAASASHISLAEGDWRQTPDVAEVRTHIRFEPQWLSCVHADVVAVDPPEPLLLFVDVDITVQPGTPFCTVYTAPVPHEPCEDGVIFAFW